MEREIKFRVWDKVDYTSSAFTLLDLQLKKIQFTSDCPIMQYTGLKDKNGKEIYEGDILSTKDILKTIDIPNVTVYWFEQEGRWICKYHGLAMDCELNDSISYTSEVIGNIYENPELLK